MAEGEFMHASIDIDWQLRFGWSDDYLKRHDIKAEKSKDSGKELIELISSAAKPLIGLFTTYGKVKHDPIYSSPYGKDAGMIVFLHTLSKWEGGNPFLVDAADALYSITIEREKNEYKLDYLFGDTDRLFHPLEVDCLALLSRLPHSISKRAKELIYKDFCPRIHYLVSKSNKSFLYDDLVSACWEILFCQVIYKYNPEKGHFSTYAITSLIHEIQKYADSQSIIKVNNRSMKRRKERGETTFINRDYGVDISSASNYDLESFFSDRNINVEDEALNRIELERAQQILAQCREILGFPDNCDISIRRYLKYKGYAYPGRDPMNTKEISQEECVCMRSIQISIKQARTRIAQLGETYPILFHLLEESEYISILSKKDEEPHDSYDKDDGWETLF